MSPHSFYRDKNLKINLLGIEKMPEDYLNQDKINFFFFIYSGRKLFDNLAIFILILFFNHTALNFKPYLKVQGEQLKFFSYFNLLSRDVFDFNFN